MQKTIAVAAAALGLGATLLLTAPGAVRAQAVPVAQAGAHAGGGRMQKLADYLGLTGAQKAQIKPILKSSMQQAKAVRQNASLAPADKKTQIKAIRQGMWAQIMPILTPDQKTKLAAMRQKQGGKG